MSATALEKSDTLIAYPAALKFFEQVTTLFAAPPNKKSPQYQRTQLEASINELKRAPIVELVAVRAVLDQMSAQIERVVDESTDASAAALQEDNIVAHALAEASAGAAVPGLTARARKENAAIVDVLHKGSSAAMQRRIDQNELVTSKQFQAALHISRQSLSEAVKAGRMFALVGPSGENFYPAFFADAELDRRSVEKVCKALGALPAASKYFFFTSPSAILDGQTPLSALKKGRVADVLVAAAGFAAQ